MTFRGFESENDALERAREVAAETSYSLADVCPCRIIGARAHLRIDHEAVVDRVADAFYREGMDFEGGV